jgi:hypothetical protein
MMPSARMSDGKVFPCEASHSRRVPVYDLAHSSIRSRQPLAQSQAPVGTEALDCSFAHPKLPTRAASIAGFPRISRQEWEANDACVAAAQSAAGAANACLEDGNGSRGERYPALVKRNVPRPTGAVGQTIDLVALDASGRGGRIIACYGWARDDAFGDLFCCSDLFPRCRTPTGK